MGSKSLFESLLLNLFCPVSRNSPVMGKRPLPTHLIRHNKHTANESERNLGWCVWAQFIGYTPRLEATRAVVRPLLYSFISSSGSNPLPTRPSKIYYLQAAFQMRPPSAHPLSARVSAPIMCQSRPTVTRCDMFVCSIKVPINHHSDASSHTQFQLPLGILLIQCWDSILVVLN